MLKKTSIALTSAGFLSLSAVSANSIQACDFELGNCTGFFYEDISSAFVDCYDANGVLASRKEAFYSTPVIKECNSADGVALVASLDGSKVVVPADLSELTDIEVCDYFTRGVGYQFSQINSGIGLAILQDRINSERDLFFQNEQDSDNDSDSDDESTPDMPAPQLNWNWAELSGLVQQLNNVQCQLVNATTDVVTPISLENFNIFAALNLPWGEWRELAMVNLDFNTWTKEELKMWVENYVMYYNAVRRYIVEGEAFLQGIADGVSTISVDLLGPYEEQIRNGLEQAKEILIQGASFLGDEFDFDTELDFALLWSPDFDLDTVTIGDIRVQLGAVSNIIVGLEGWFTTFFLEGGIDALLGQNTTFVIEGENGQTTSILTGNAENTVTLNVPSQVEAIVAWITTNFNTELQSVLAQYNVTFVPGTVIVNNTDSETEVPDVDDNSTLPEDNSTEGEDGDNEGDDEDLDIFINYILPEGCQFTDEANTEVRCERDNGRIVAFTIPQIENYFKDGTAEKVCTDFTSAFASCQETSEENIQGCLETSFFGRFQVNQQEALYGQLSYDSVARDVLYQRCVNNNPGFAEATPDVFEQAFNFDFSGSN